jgi:hypothetical protein
MLGFVSVGPFPGFFLPPLSITLNPAVDRDQNLSGPPDRKHNWREAHPFVQYFSPLNKRTTDNATQELAYRFDQTLRVSLDNH